MATQSYCLKGKFKAIFQSYGEMTLNPPGCSKAQPHKSDIIWHSFSSILLQELSVRGYLLEIIFIKAPLQLLQALLILNTALI